MLGGGQLTRSDGFELDFVLGVEKSTSKITGETPVDEAGINVSSKVSRVEDPPVVALGLVEINEAIARKRKFVVITSDNS